MTSVSSFPAACAPVVLLADKPSEADDNIPGAAPAAVVLPAAVATTGVDALPPSAMAGTATGVGWSWIAATAIATVLIPARARDVFADAGPAGLSAMEAALLVAMAGLGSMVVIDGNDDAEMAEVPVTEAGSIIFTETDAVSVVAGVEEDDKGALEAVAGSGADRLGAAAPVVVVNDDVGVIEEVDVALDSWFGVPAAAAAKVADALESGTGAIAVEADLTVTAGVGAFDIVLKFEVATVLFLEVAAVAVAVDVVILAELVGEAFEPGAAIEAVSTVDARAVSLEVVAEVEATALRGVAIATEEEDELSVTANNGVFLPFPLAIPSVSVSPKACSLPFTEEEAVVPVSPTALLCFPSLPPVERCRIASLACSKSRYTVASLPIS